MSKRALLTVSLLALLRIAAQAQGKDEPGSTAPITVYTDFQTKYSAELLASLKSELTAIMGPIGLQFEWRDLKAARGNEVSIELVVVSFKGRCQTEASLPRQSLSGALGWTHMSDGEVLPFSDVDCDRVRSLIGPHILDETRADQERLFGRAQIGRAHV